MNDRRLRQPPLPKSIVAAMTGTVAALAVLLTAASAVAAPSAEAAKFREWATTAAKRANLVVCRFWNRCPSCPATDRSGNSSPQNTAMVCSSIVRSPRFVRLSSASIFIFALVATLSGEGTALAAPIGDQSRFQAWATTAAKQADLRVCRWGSAAYDQHQTAATFALFRQAKGQRWALVVMWGQQSRAYLSDLDPLQQTSCSGATPPAWEKVQAIELPEIGMSPKETASIALIDDDLVVLSALSPDRGGNDSVDWVQLSETHSDFGTQKERAGAILPVLDVSSPWNAKLPKPENFVTFSRSPRGGSADAKVTPHLSLNGSDLRIDLSASDDVFLPPANPKVSDRDFLKSDHFELWFCAPLASGTCGKKAVRQLGVAKTADGKAHARWLLPKGNEEKLPEVTATGGPGPGATVDLPLALIGHKGDATSALEGKLTVAYSDADEATQGQKTVVATSNLRWGDAETFGRFVRQDDGGRFPTWHGAPSFERDIDFLESLPKLPNH